MLVSRSDNDALLAVRKKRCASSSVAAVDPASEPNAMPLWACARVDDVMTSPPTQAQKRGRE